MHRKSAGLESFLFDEDEKDCRETQTRQSFGPVFQRHQIGDQIRQLVAQFFAVARGNGVGLEEGAGR